MSVRLILDGVDRTAGAQVTATGLTFTPAAPLSEGAHTATLFVRDLAGNQVQAHCGFTTDSVAPTLTITAPEGPEVLDNATPNVAVTFSDTTSGIALDTLQIFVGPSNLTLSCTVVATAASCRSLPLQAGSYTVLAYVRDHADNLVVASSDFHLSFDEEPPILMITAPDSPLIVGNVNPRIGLAYSDPNGVNLASLRVVLDSADITSGCSPAPATAACQSPALARGPHTIHAEVRDSKGNLAMASFSFVVSFPLAITFTEPSPETTLTAPEVRIAGTVASAARSVRVNGLAASLGGGAFSIDNFGLRDGVNNLVAVAEDDAGNTGTATVRVVADVTPPRISISSPVSGAVTSASTINVTGLVNDLSVGTTSEAQVSVTVNGTVARVANRSFLASSVRLKLGRNQLIAEATDRAGNRGMTTIEVVRKDAQAATLAVVSGEAQAAPILSELPGPLVVRISDAKGQPRIGVQVVFRVAQGNGVLDSGERAVVRISDDKGEAAVRWTLGSRAGMGVNRVQVTAPGVAGEALFTAISSPGPPSAIHVVSGNNQSGAVGTELSLPLIAVVIDRGDNPLSGVAVTFRVVRGGGRFGTSDTSVVPTDASGLAMTRLALGPEGGRDNNLVAATFEGLGNEPASFVASALVPGDPADTKIAGLVFDNQGQPVPGVTLRLRDSTLRATTDDQGQFRLTGVPAGQVFLIADASTATRPGSWASLEFELFAVAGVENSLPKPIYILPLDLAHGLLVDEIRGGIVTLADLPGFALEIAPGSVTFPGGSRSGVVSVTAVHVDKIPMAPGGGMQPRLIVTIQPAGARFNPPAPMTLPNVDAQQPGRVVELFSFDHDIGSFVAIGTGTVSEDGQVIRSDPGFGIVQAGWHCGAPPSASGAGASLSAKLSPKPIKIQYGETTTVTAKGQPPLDGSYLDWQVTGANFDNMANFSSQPSCSDQSACQNILTSTQLAGPLPFPSKVCGTATAKVQFECRTTGRTVNATATIEQGCGGKDAQACRDICASEPAQGMCGTPCELTGQSHPPFNHSLGGACWKAKINSTWYCYWDLRSSTPGHPNHGFDKLCCPNHCFGNANTGWGQGDRDYTCTIIERCDVDSPNSPFGGSDDQGNPGAHCVGL